MVNTKLYDRTQKKKRDEAGVEISPCYWHSSLDSLKKGSFSFSSVCATPSQQQEWSFKGPNKFQLGCFPVGSNVHVKV